MPNLLSIPHRRRHRRRFGHRPRHCARLRARGRAGCRARHERRGGRRKPPSRSKLPAARRKPSPSTSPDATTASRWRKRSPPRPAASRSWSTMPASTGATPFTADPARLPQGLAGHHGDQSQRRVQRDARLPAQLRAAKGRIVNIGSIQSFVHVRTPNSAAYTTSKHGVLGFTKALAAELGKDGVRVNAIGPGLIETPLNEKVRANNPELIKIFSITPRSAAPASRRTSSARRSSSPPISRLMLPARS